MDNISAEKSLIHFARVNSEIILGYGKYPDRLRVIVSEITNLDEDDQATVITNEQADTLRVDDELDETYINSCSLSDNTVIKLFAVACKLIKMAADTDTTDTKTHKAIQSISSILWPLYSRDERIGSIGFDLQEYSDFFEDLPEAERYKLESEIFDKWFDNNKKE